MCWQAYVFLSSKLLHCPSIFHLRNGLCCVGWGIKLCCCSHSCVNKIKNRGWCITIVKTAKTNEPKNDVSVAFGWCVRKSPASRLDGTGWRMVRVWRDSRTPASWQSSRWYTEAACAAATSAPARSRPFTRRNSELHSAGSAGTHRSEHCTPETWIWTIFCSFTKTAAKPMFLALGSTYSVSEHKFLQCLVQSMD